MIGTTSTGRFKITTGQIIDSDSDTSSAAGLSVYEARMGDMMQIPADLQGVNCSPLNFYSYPDPSVYAAFIQTKTSKGILAGTEGHTSSDGSNAGTGSGILFRGAGSTNGMNLYSAAPVALTNISAHPGATFPPTQTVTPFAGLVPTPTPAPTPMVTPSANDAVINAGSTAVIVDATGNKWTITAGAQVSVNGTADAATANVTELAYVNGQIWQENASKLWWGKASPAASWSPKAGSSTSPLPPTVTIASTQTSATISLGNATIAATAGDHMVFIIGAGDTARLAGGTDTITDTGRNTTYLVPAAGTGYDAFVSNVLTLSDNLDLRSALAATHWTGSASTVSRFLSVTDTTQGAVLSVSTQPGGVGTGIASFRGATAASLTSVLAHAIT